MPQVRLRSSSIQDSLNLRGKPTASELANIATTHNVQDVLNTVILEDANIAITDNTMSDSTDTN